MTYIEEVHPGSSKQKEYLSVVGGDILWEMMVGLLEDGTKMV